MLKVLDDVCKPTKGSKYSAAIDLYAREDVVIGAGETVKVPLGVCVDEDIFYKNYYNYYKLDNSKNKIDYEFSKMFSSHYLQLEPRSSLRAKGLIVGTGIIDLDYRDEIMIILLNPITFKAIVKWIFSFGRNKSVFKISKGEKIAQILLKEHKTYLMGIDTQEERTGGFGSTDKK